MGGRRFFTKILVYGYLFTRQNLQEYTMPGLKQALIALFTKVQRYFSQLSLLEKTW
jgi:hypothetical protein